MVLPTFVFLSLDKIYRTKGLTIVSEELRLFNGWRVLRIQLRVILSYEAT